MTIKKIRQSWWAVLTIWFGLLSSAPAAPPVIGACQILPTDHIFNTRIDDLPVHPDSASYLQTINSGVRNLHLDLGTSEDMQDSEYYGIPYNVVAGNTLNWQPVFYTDGWPQESDCAVGDKNIARPCITSGTQPALPIPDTPLVEGGIEVNPANDGDHHILSIDSHSCVLWESYHSYPHSGGGWDILSSAAFDLRSNALRPAGWTSADAAGFPILPLLLRADEASSGMINHALRFTIQSGKIRNSYVWPARHHTNNGGSLASKPAMGQLFRLKASYAIPASFTTQARAILTAMQQYGMYIADGGSDMFVQGEPNTDWLSTTISQVQTVPHTAFEAVDLSPLMARAGFNPDSAAVPGSTITTTTQYVAPGWNLLGNGRDAALDVTTLFGDSTKVVSVWKWLSSGKWAFYAPSMTRQELIDYTSSKGYEIVAVINGGDGFWINAHQAFTFDLLTANPVTAASMQSQLVLGWNLVAIGETKTPGEFNRALSQTPPTAGIIPVNLMSLWAWNNSQSKWYFYTPTLESQGGTALTDYTTSKGYLDFTMDNKTLGNGTGFWVNRP